MRKCFVVMSGLPGSGKTTLAGRLAPHLSLPVIDKDEILERLFESQGSGDASWRRRLSRESDALLQARATNSDGAILVSHWRLPGMPADSGTPLHWLPPLSACIVNVECSCPPELSARRFAERTRHAGHLDCARSFADVLKSLWTLAALGPLDIGRRVVIDTTLEPKLDDVIDHVVRAFGEFDRS
jgi:GTPase SAR1 family protein